MDACQPNPSQLHGKASVGKPSCPPGPLAALNIIQWDYVTSSPGGLRLWPRPVAWSSGACLLTGL
ncbi:MAG: hypothetical protein MJD61_09895, partial [Proteobacteria bacterium]|nr:hypothetical protein [Pseudomonadota bacterium]